MGLGIFKGKIDIGDTSKNLLDKLDDSKFTDEEKSRVNLLKAEKSAEFTEKTLDENTIRSKTRRGISYVIVGNVFGAFWYTVILYTIGKVDVANYIKELAIEWKLITAFVMTIAFFFGGYYANTIAEKFKRKK